ncbi:MAG: M28 family peptidase, partial [Hyphococcus sp.]
GNAQFFIDASNDEPALDISIQVSEPAAERLFVFANKDYEAATTAAAAAPGRGFAFDASADIHFESERRRLKSSNVVATIKGAVKPDECVIYTAHWDHIGVNPDLEGDTIFNGALDNATGTAGLLELAEAFARLPERPRRSVYFVATAVEEKGLLGAQYLVDNPICEPEKTVAVLNMDSHFPFGSFDAMTIVGYGYSELQDEFETAAAKVGRVIQPDSNPEVGAFFRNDSYPFAKAGIPAIYAVGGPRNGTLESNPELLARYIDFGANKYHKPGDEYDPETWDLTGVEEDVRVFFEVGRSLATGTRFPNWRYDLPYRERRDSMMAD